MNKEANIQHSTFNVQHRTPMTRQTPKPKTPGEHPTANVDVRDKYFCVFFRLHGISARHVRQTEFVSIRGIDSLAPARPALRAFGSAKWSSRSCQWLPSCHDFALSLHDGFCRGVTGSNRFYRVAIGS